MSYRRDKEPPPPPPPPPPRQSSLPSSLIPHLYSAPQHQPRDSSTRTTLEAEEPPLHHSHIHPVSPVFSLGTPLQTAPTFDPRRTYYALYEDQAGSSSMPGLATSNPLQQRYSSPIYSDPAFHASRAVQQRNPTYAAFPPPLSPREGVYQRTSWREGEAGPSSLAQPIRRPPERHRGQPSYPSMADNYGRGNAAFEHAEHGGGSSSLGELLRRDSYTQPFQGLPPPSQLVIPSSDDHDLSFPYDRQDVYSYPPVGSLSISAPPSANVRTPESPEMVLMYRSTDDGDEAHKGKRRRAESVETDDNARKSRNPRKTAVACNFCRGRKLRCNGVKPSCYNCTVRKFECEYVPIQRRRGPGKAPKGSRARKGGGASRSDPSGSSCSKNVDDRSPSRLVPEYELEALAPELRPYTSVMSLDHFGFYYPHEQTPPRSRESSTDAHCTDH